MAEFPRSLTVQCLAEGLCVCSHLLQEETSLRMAEQGLDLLPAWGQEANILKEIYLISFTRSMLNG